MKINDVAIRSASCITNKGQRIALLQFIQVWNYQLEVHHASLPFAERTFVDCTPSNHVRKILVVLLIACRFHNILRHWESLFRLQYSRHHFLKFSLTTFLELPAVHSTIWTKQFAVLRIQSRDNKFAIRASSGESHQERTCNVRRAAINTKFIHNRLLDS